MANRPMHRVQDVPASPPETSGPDRLFPVTRFDFKEERIPMKRALKNRRVLFVTLLILASTTAWAVLAQRPQRLIDPEANMLETAKLLFIHQDVVTSFPATGDGVRSGTMRGAISGSTTTNFQFLAVPPPEFASDDWTLLTDPDGDQILFRVQVAGRFLVFLEAPANDSRRHLNQVGGPFTGIYEVVEATGKYQGFVGRKFPCKGIGTLPAKNQAIGSVYAEIYSDEFEPQNP